VGIFNGLFPETAVTQGIDLFIYIVSALVLFLSETQVLKYPLNNEEPASSTSGSSNVEVQSIGFRDLSSLFSVATKWGNSLLVLLKFLLFPNI
jgi:hypothetical protein